MLRMVRLCNNKCSETGPKQHCSGPEQYQYLFWYNLYRILIIRPICIPCSVLIRGSLNLTNSLVGEMSK